MTDVFMRRVLGGWMVMIDELPCHYATADEALDDWLDWLATGKQPEGMVILSDPPEWVEMPS